MHIGELGNFKTLWRDGQVCREKWMPGSALWVQSTDYPDFIYPFASAIDTPLPEAPESTHLMLAHKPPWVAVNAADHDARFDLYPDIGIEQWHKKRGLFGDQ